MDFTAIDVETANSKRASICAVGLAKVRGGQLVDTVSWLVDPPGGPVFEKINIRKHGITGSNLGDAQPWPTTFAGILAFSNGDTLAHHSPFDIQAIIAACSLSGVSTPTLNYIDTETLARATLSLESFALPDVAKSLGLPPFEHHNAEDDAVTCARILVKLARPYGSIDALVAATPQLPRRRSWPGSTMSAATAAYRPGSSKTSGPFPTDNQVTMSGLTECWPTPTDGLRPGRPVSSATNLSTERPTTSTGIGIAVKLARSSSSARRRNSPVKRRRNSSRTPPTC